MVKRLIAQRRYHYLVLMACALLYAGVTLFGPHSSNTYNLSPFQFGLVQLTVILPVILIWVAAFFGAVGFRAYADTIKKSQDGKAFTEVSQGLLILAFGVVVTTLFGSFKNIMISQGNAEIFMIIKNYLTVGFEVAAFYKIFQGSQKLRSVKQAVVSTGRAHVFATAGLVLISLIYAYVMLRNPYRNNTPDPQTFSSFYLPDWLIVLTIIIPFAISWIWGAFAAINFLAYNRSVKGMIYKSALFRLVLGIVGVTIFSISLQFLSALTSSLQNLKLSGILGVVYIILLLYAGGYLFIASGAKKLARIEEA